MTREEYTKLDVEDYFNYMGMLAAEVTAYCAQIEAITPSAQLVFVTV